jgi:HrpA-like RNA helicase
MATDIVLALLKIAVQARGDLKIIIMSATLDVERFSTYFEGSSFFNVPGRLYPVDVKYLEEPTANYFHCGITLAYSLHQSQGSGDILLFLPTVEMVEKACVLLKEHTTYLEVFPLYAELPKGAQHRALLRYTNRKCVVATGVAETSLTIDGIVFVIGLSTSCGFSMGNIANHEH